MDRGEQAQATREDFFGAQHRSPAHDWISLALLFETLAIYAVLVGAAVWAARAGAGPWTLAALALALGLWLDRMYTVGHEAGHRKLFPDHPRLNDLVGSVMFAPLMVPLVVYRKIHAFHHGHNRRAPKVATLDVVQLPPEPGLRRRLARLVGWAGWLLGVFAGGFYIHGLVSIVLFLVLPTKVACRVSPAFRNWKPRHRLRAWLELGAGAALHVLVWRLAGADVWLAAFGLPTLAFAWIYSLMVYIYHYDTTIGGDIRYNVRSLPPSRVLSWLLLNFNEHVTHHADPRLPWYMLPRRRIGLPPEYAGNAKVRSVLGAILQQLRGPVFVDRGPRA